MASKDKVRLVTRVGPELAAAIRAAVEEAGISEAMLIRLALSEYLEVPLSLQDQHELRPQRQARPVPAEAVRAARESGRTRHSREVSDLLTRLRRERGLAQA